MRSKYIVIALFALTLGFAAAYWRASTEIGLQTEAAHRASVARLAAEADAKALTEKLTLEKQAHDKAANRAAEADRKLAEQIGAAKALSEKLALESKARETAERAHDKAANRAAEEARKLAEQIGAAKALSEKLAQESKARETAERAHDKAANRAAEEARKLAEQAGMTRKIETRLADAESKLKLASETAGPQIAAH
ncbi:MAG: hypothetical protein ACLPX9_15215 [Rhodomicrobium sp.]